MATNYEFFRLNKGANLDQQDLELYEKEITKLYSEFSETCDDLKHILNKKYDKIYAVGIGDSLYSAESVKLAAWNNSGQHIEVIESYEFNYYYINYMPKNSLVIICSGGGQAARTVESSYLAQKRGATVVALTLSPHSRLISATGNTLCYVPNRKAYIDGACNYIALASMLHIVNIKLGRWHGNLTEEEEIEEYKKSIKLSVAGFEAAMGENNKKIQTIAQELYDGNHEKILFLGAGPGYILTELGCAKFMEQAAFVSIHQQLEEYSHEQYWIHNRNNNNDFVVLICPEGKTQARSLELLEELKYLGCTTIAITSSGYNNEIEKYSDYLLVAPTNYEDEYFWLAAANILTRLANFFTAHLGLSNKQFANDDQPAKHYKAIQFSRFCDEVTEFDIPLPDEEILREKGPHGLEFNKK